MKPSQVVERIAKAIGRERAYKWAARHGVERTTLSKVMTGAIPPTQQLCEIVGVIKSTVTKYEVKK